MLYGISTPGLFFFYLKGGNLETASLAGISDFADKTVEKMNKALKIQRLNRQKLGLKSITNHTATNAI